MSTTKRLTALVLVTVTLAAVRRYFVPMLTRATGTWIGGVDGSR